MEFTIISVLVFASITMCLVLLLNLAEKKLLPQGDVSILINDEPDKALSVGTGGTLLGALSGQKVFLPSACGGGEHVQCASVKYLKEEAIYFQQRLAISAGQRQKIIGD